MKNHTFAEQSQQWVITEGPTGTNDTGTVPVGTYTSSNR